MDFMVGLSKTQKGFGTIWVIVDRLTKATHFLPIRISYPLNKLAKLYMDEIMRLHDIPATIVSDRDPQFTSRF